MLKKRSEPILNNFLTQILPSEGKKQFIPLKDQSTPSFMLDMLGRKKDHHLLLYNATSEIYNLAFIEHFAHFFSENTTPTSLIGSQLFFLNTKLLSLINTQSTQFADEFLEFCDEKNLQATTIIVVITEIEGLFNNLDDPNLKAVAQILKSLLLNNKWRIIGFSSSAKIAPSFALKNFFSILKLQKPNHDDSVAILKSFLNDFETYHQVIIPEETFAQSLFLAEKFLNAREPLIERSFKLLDSASARASMIKQNDSITHNKPIVNFGMLTKVISHQTKIPMSHLQLTKFKSSDLINTLKKNIFGQELALDLIGLVLQHAQIRFQETTGPLCSFLFAGPQNVGKTKTAYALAEYLFGQKTSLFNVQMNRSQLSKSLADVHVTRQADEYHAPLFQAIQKSPYAVILFEHVDQHSMPLLKLFEDVFKFGYALDSDGKKYDFRHAIIVITTTVGSEKIINLSQPHLSDNNEQTLDLLQLVLNESQKKSIHHPQPFSAQELCEEMYPAFEALFSSNVLQCLNIIPFVLLDHPSLEAIIRGKLKHFAAHLHSQYNIELSYAPEIIRFLTHECLWRGTIKKSIENVLQHHLYSCVAFELVSNVEEKKGPKRMLLQLNESGQLIRCELLSSEEPLIYHSSLSHKF